MINRVFSSLLIYLFFSSTAFSQQLPDELQGDWFAADGSNTWVLGLHPSYAVYNAEFWDFSDVSRESDYYLLKLKQRDARKVIKVKKTAQGIEIVEDLKTLKAIAQRLDVMSKAPEADGYSSDFIKPGMVELSGVLKPKADMPLVASVIYNDAFSEEQPKFTVNVDELGRFNVSFPLNSPQAVMLRVGQAFSFFLAEPGAKMALWIDESSFSDDFDSWYTVKDMRFMGDMARQNEEHRLYKPAYMRVRNYFENDSLQRQLEPMEYLDYRLKLMKSHQDFNQEYFSENSVTKELMQYADREVRLYAANDLMRFRWLHNMRSTRMPVDLPDNYLDTVKTLVTNDPRELISGEYGDLMRELGMRMMPKERETDHKVRVDRIYDFLKGKAVSETNRQLLDYWKNWELGRNNHFGGVKFPDTVKTLTDAFSDEIKALNLKATWDIFKESVEQYDQLALSCIVNTYLDRTYFSRGEEVPDFVLEDVRQLDMITMASELFEQRKQDLDILKNERFVEGVEISETKSNILSQLKSKYAGKVVYIDVWATWCGPCISEFSQLPAIKPAFEEREDVVFVYLCAQSKEDSWKAMVKRHQLKGDNLFLNDNQFGLFDQATNVTGFPTYMVITKEGKLVREGIKRPSAGKELIDQLIEFADR